MGTPMMALNSNGKKVWSQTLDIFGRNTEKSTNFVPFRYQGQYYDEETGLSYNRFRYYDDSTGQYISQDPIGLAGGNPTLYGYVKDVNSWIDIFGLKKKSSKRKPKYTSTKSTGRTRTHDKNEDFALDFVQKHPEAGAPVPLTKEIGDPCYKGKGWIKYGKTVNGVEVHYMAKVDLDGNVTEVTDFKIKQNHNKTKHSHH